MNDLKWYFNTEDVSLPHKREVMFGEDGTITELLVDFYIGRIKKFMCD